MYTLMDNNYWKGVKKSHQLMNPRDAWNTVALGTFSRARCMGRALCPTFLHSIHGSKPFFSLLL